MGRNWSARRVLFNALLALGLATACTQLFDDRQNTLEPARPAFGRASSLPAAEAKPLVCAPGASRCDGALLQSCAGDGSGWLTLQRCDGAGLCQAQPPACLAGVCSAGEMTCDGAVLLSCNAERSGWEVFATCASSAHCNADQRQCLAEPCSAEQRRCNRSPSGVPAIERCLGDQSGWETLSVCDTRELCEQSLSGSPGGLVLSGDNSIALAPPVDPASVTTCAVAACAAGEARCAGAQLEVCNPGRTGFDVAEQCGSAALCESSLANRDATGQPHCVVPACAPGTHQCTELGALEVCNEDRSGFRTISTCLGAAYCNAALADQGGNGCTAEPCEPGVMQCNGAQIERCRADSSGFDDVRAPCASAALCNDDEPSAARCEPPLCQRGDVSSDEFRCEGTSLQRCNEDGTGYEPFASCATAELCDAGRRFEGCVEPACDTGQHSCNGVFLARCKADRTGFEDIENCGSAGQCDADAGRCSDPCEPGAVRCSSASGDLEQCTDRLTGWQVVGDCLTPQLCDAGNRRCNQPVCAPGQRRCSQQGNSPVIEQCAPGRDRFEVVRTCAQGQLCDAQNLQCDSCVANAVSCQGDTLVTCDASGQSQSRQQCGPGLCDAERRRCLACDPIGSARCTDRQLFVCTAGQQGEFERSEFCQTDELCTQTLNGCGSGLNGQSCQCNPGSCSQGQLRCNADGSLQRCNEGLTGFDQTGVRCNPAGLCNVGTGDCDACFANQLSCGANNTVRQCSNNGRSFAVQNQNAVCQGNTLIRCQNGQVAQQQCGNGLCNAPAARCNQCTGNGFLRCENDAAVSCGNGLEVRTGCNGQGCNAQRGGCNQCNFTGSRCNGNQLQTCNNGTLQTQSCANGCNAQRNACNQCIVGTTICLNGTQEQSCPSGLPTTTNCANGCFQNQCADCGAGVCANGNTARRECINGQLGAPINCPVDNTCTGAGVCVPACTTGATRCQNGVPQRCNNGSNFAPLAACAGNAAARCNGNQVIQETCGAGSVCQNGSCAVQQICTPGAFNACSADGLSIVNCNAAGTGFTTTSCGSGRACSAGEQACVNATFGTAPTACQEGQVVRCSGDLLLRCATDGTTFTEACPNRQVCRDEGNGPVCSNGFTAPPAPAIPPGTFF